MAIGQVLGISDNSVNVTVKRIGGGFGAKIDQCNIISTAAALAATTIRKPVKIVVDLDTNMTIYGGRDPFYSTYKVGVDDQGLLQAVQATITSDSGTFEGVTLMEEILDHVAATLNIDPIDIRKRNLMLNGSTMRVNHCLLRARARLAGKADVDARKQAVAEFNQANRWKKRGIALMSMSWPHSVDLRYPFSVLVSINARDGSVAVSHGGTEMGQGINTK
ncbi:Xanthine dehydrogenase/oxidase-like 3, partial [Homarus americanus]